MTVSDRVCPWHSVNLSRPLSRLNNGYLCPVQRVVCSVAICTNGMGSLIAFRKLSTKSKHADLLMIRCRIACDSSPVQCGPNAQSITTTITQQEVCAHIPAIPMRLEVRPASRHAPSQRTRHHAAISGSMIFQTASVYPSNVQILRLQYASSSAYCSAPVSGRSGSPFEKSIGFANGST